MEEKSADSKSGKPKRRRRPWRCSGCKTRRKQCPRNCVQMYTMNSKKDFETFSDGLRNCLWMEHVFGAVIFSVGSSWMIINENHIFWTQQITKVSQLTQRKRSRKEKWLHKIIQGFRVFSLAEIKKLNCANGSRFGDNCKMGFHEIFMILLLKIPDRTRFANRGLEISFQIGTW